jgi:hypothetical protein
LQEHVLALSNESLRAAQQRLTRFAKLWRGAARRWRSW